MIWGLRCGASYRPSFIARGAVHEPPLQGAFRWPTGLVTLTATAAVILGIPRALETVGAASATLLVLGEVQGRADEYEDDGHGNEGCNIGCKHYLWLWANVGCVLRTI